jgi:hypothetical protein
MELKLYKPQSTEILDWKKYFQEPKNGEVNSSNANKQTKKNGEVIQDVFIVGNLHINIGHSQALVAHACKPNTWTYFKGTWS